MKIKLSVHGYAKGILVYNNKSPLFKLTQNMDENLLAASLFENEKFLAMKINYQEEQIQNYLELITDQKFSILERDNFTRIEIKREGRRAYKLFTKDIDNKDQLLFPAYNIHEKIRNVAGLIIIEQEMGYLGSTYITSDAFDIQKLHFTVSEFPVLGLKGITNIRYDKELLIFRGGKTLIQNRRAYRREYNPASII